MQEFSFIILFFRVFYSFLFPFLNCSDSMCGWFCFQGDTGYMLDGFQKINNLYQNFRKQPQLIQNRTLFYGQKLGDSFLIVGQNLPNGMILKKIQADGMRSKFISQLDCFLEIEYSKIKFQPKSTLIYSTSYGKLALRWIKMEVEYGKLDFGQDFGWKSILLYSIFKKQFN